MKDTNSVKTALFDVKIISENINVDHKGISYDQAKKIIEDIILLYPNNKFIQERATLVLDDLGFISISDKKNSINISAYKARINNINEEKHTCPRRQEGPQYDITNKDTWDLRGEDLCCSYCGSIKPSRVIELIKQLGWGIIEQTNKSYKKYLNRPSVPNASFGGIKFYTQHFSKEEIQEYNDMLKIK